MWKHRRQLYQSPTSEEQSLDPGFGRGDYTSLPSAKKSFTAAPGSAALLVEPCLAAHGQRTASRGCAAELGAAFICTGPRPQSGPKIRAASWSLFLNFTAS